jgi:hypothetical protein
LHHPLLLLFKLSLKLLELLQLGQSLPHRWWHGCACVLHNVGWGVFVLIIIKGSFTILPIAHEAFTRQVMTPIIRVKTPMKAIVIAKELALSPRVIKPGEISISPSVIIFLGVNTRGHRRSRKEL